ncbi:MAG: hypothetical protein HC831_23625 [Chloroflexia bacterium]|nr:hypothetical protein [Chloroflexia bacterium]
MRRIAKILIIILLFSQDTLAQSVNCDSLIEHSTIAKYLVPNSRTEYKLKCELNKVQNYINFRIFLFAMFSDHEEFQELVFERIGENIIIKDNVQFRNSIYVMLRSGLSWDILNGPPSKPKRFIFKFFSKKGRA